MVKKILLYIVVILVSMQIYGASAQVATESAEMSGRITEKIVKIITLIKDVEPENMNELFETVHRIIRKVAHFVEYAVLTFFVFLLARSYDLKTGLCFLISLVYCLLFASFDEWHQLYVAGRSGEIRDVLIDFCGGISGSVFCWFFVCLTKKIKKDRT